MAKSILQIVIQTLKEGDADKETIQGFKDLQSNITQVTQIAGAMAAAYAVVDKVIGESVRQTIAYADSVDQLSQISGQSAEDTSRLISLTQQYGVATDALTMANKTLSKEGMTMSIDTMGKLSDKYKMIQNDADRAKFLTDNFGKSGYALADMMELGSRAINDQAAAIDKYLILTDKEIAQAKQFTILQEQNAQAVKGFGVAIGTTLIPYLSDLEVVLTKDIERQYGWMQIFGYLAPVIGQITLIQDLTGAHQQNTDALEKMTAKQKVSTDAADTAAEAAKKLADAEKLVADANKAITQSNQEFNSTLSAVAANDLGYQNTSIKLTQERQKIETDRHNELVKGASGDIKKVQEYDQALVDNSAAVDKNQADFELANHKIILGILERKLTADGVLDDKEEAWLLNLGQKWGIYSAQMVSETKDMMNQANNLASSIEGIPDTKTVHITIEQDLVYSGNSALNAASDGLMHGRDSGGPGEAGHAYVIGPSAGPEMFIPATDGYFVPNVDKFMGGGAVTVNLSYAPAVSVHDQATITGFVYAGIRKAKADGLLK